jgi:hypothetical protein
MKNPPIEFLNETEGRVKRTFLFQPEWLHILGQKLCPEGFFNFLFKFQLCMVRALLTIHTSQD